MSSFFLQVSRGSECVMISKKFFINQASELTKKWIRHNVSIILFPQTMKHAVTPHAQTTEM